MMMIPCRVQTPMSQYWKSPVETIHLFLDEDPMLTPMKTHVKTLQTAAVMMTRWLFRTWRGAGRERRSSWPPPHSNSVSLPHQQGMKSDTIQSPQLIALHCTAFQYTSINKHHLNCNILPGRALTSSLPGWWGVAWLQWKYRWPGSGDLARSEEKWPGRGEVATERGCDQCERRWPGGRRSGRGQGMWPVWREVARERAVGQVEV